MTVAEIAMPSLGADMDAGTVVEWRIAPGDVIHRGDIVAVISTDKADMDVEAFVDGVVEELLVAEGDTVTVGTPLARIAPSAAGTRARSERSTSRRSREVPAPHEADAGGDREPAPHGEHPQHSVVRSPLVRRLAEERHVDLDHIAGTGPGGSVTRADVERAEPTPDAGHDEGHVPASPLARARARRLGLDLAGVVGSGPGGAVLAADLDTAAAPQGTTARAGAAQSTDDGRRAALRRSVGDLMARSKREIPHYHLETAIDLGAATTWITAANVDRPPADRLVPAALLLRAVTLACASNPAMNGHFVDGMHQPVEEVHLGVAISLRGGGLVAPAIADAHTLGVEELMVRLRSLVERARSGRLRSSELIDPTITVTNLGDQGSDAVFGVIYPPQVALVGFGRIVERPWVIGGELCVRPAVTATLAADHRVSDGHDGSVFLSKVDRLLQRPEKL